MAYDSQVEVLIDAVRLEKRIQELGEQITRDYQGKHLMCVGVLKGCVPFIADLMRHIQLPLSVDYLGVSSYGEGTHSSGVVRVTSDLSKPIEGKDVLLIEDIVDTGLTMQYLLDSLATRHPASLKVCSLLFKPAQNRIKVPVDYLGFEVPPLFVVGYGLDYGELYRNLPYIGVLKA